MVPKRWYSESTKYLANGDQVTKTCHNGVCTTKTIKAKPGSQGGCNGGCGGKPEVQKEGNGLPEGANGKVPVAKTELPETTAVMTTQAMITQAVTTLFAMTQAPTTPAPKSVCSSKAAKLRENNMVPLKNLNLPDCVIVRMNQLARAKGCYKPSCWGNKNSFNGHVKTENTKGCSGINCELPPTESPEIIIVKYQAPVAGTVLKNDGVPGCTGKNCGSCPGGNCASVPPCVDDANDGQGLTTTAETTVYEETTTEEQVTSQRITSQQPTTQQPTTQQPTTQQPTTEQIETFPATTETDGSGMMSAQPGLLPIRSSNNPIKPGQNGKLGNKNKGVQTSFVENRNERRRLRNQIRRLKQQLKLQNQQRNRKSVEHNKSTLLYGNLDSTDCGSMPGACKKKVAVSDNHDFINSAWESDDI